MLVSTSIKEELIALARNDSKLISDLQSSSEEFIIKLDSALNLRRFRDYYSLKDEYNCLVLSEAERAVFEYNQAQRVKKINTLAVFFKHHMPYWSTVENGLNKASDSCINKTYKQWLTFPSVDLVHAVFCSIT